MDTTLLCMYSTIFYVLIIFGVHMKRKHVAAPRRDARLCDVMYLYAFACVGGHDGAAGQTGCTHTWVITPQFLMVHRGSHHLQRACAFASLGSWVQGALSSVHALSHRQRPPGP